VVWPARSGRCRFNTDTSPVGRTCVAQWLTRMTDDEWQAHMTREAARAIGTWLEGRGRLHQPIAALTLADLEAMATNAISRFVVLGMARIKHRPPEAGSPMQILLA
jgi:hypothetical protein